MKTSHAPLSAFFLALTFGLVAWADPSPVTQSRPLTGFDRIELRGSVDVTVREGPKFSVEVVATPEMQKKIHTRVKNHTLIVDNEHDISFSLHGSHFSFHGDGGAKIRVVMPRFWGLSTEGSGDAEIQVAHRNDVTLSTSGSGDIQFEGLAGKLSATSSGSGAFTLRGTATSLSVDTSGSGDVSAKDFTVQSANVQTTGSGDVTLTVRGGPLDLSSSGSGDIDWYGTAGKVAQASNGSGDITHHHG